MRNFGIISAGNFFFLMKGYLVTLSSFPGLSEQNGGLSSWLGHIRKTTGLTTEKQAFSLKYKKSCGGNALAALFLHTWRPAF